MPVDPPTPDLARITDETLRPVAEVIGQPVLGRWWAIADLRREGVQPASLERGVSFAEMMREYEKAFAERVAENMERFAPIIAAGLPCARDSDWCDGVICRERGIDCPRADPVPEGR